MKSAFFDRFSFSASSSSHALMSTARMAQIGEKAAMSLTNIQTYCAGWDLRGAKASGRYVMRIIPHRRGPGVRVHVVELRALWDFWFRLRGLLRLGVGVRPRLVRLVVGVRESGDRCRAEQQCDGPCAHHRFRCGSLRLL